MTSPLKIFILVPSLDLSGPVRGAIALANGLANSYPVTLVVLKRVLTKKDLLRHEVTLVSLESIGGIWGKFHAYKRMLKQEHSPVSLSFCFSADLVNFFLAGKIRTLTSIRATISKSYPIKFGPVGHLLARLHYLLMRRFDQVLVLSESMKRHMERHHLKRLTVVGNFIDEPLLDRFRSPSLEPPRNGVKTIAFIGSFTKRKRTDLLIDAARSLRDGNIPFTMWLIGDGPLQNNLKERVKQLDLGENIRFFGYIDEPYSLLQQANLFALPSESEGVPRAALEALFFGVPCLLRDIDSNAELIQHGVNGYLFKSDQDFSRVLLNALTKDLKSQQCLIPPNFRRDNNIKKFLSVIRNAL